MNDKKRSCSASKQPYGIWDRFFHCQHVSGSPERWVRYVPIRFFGMEGEAWFLGSTEEQLSSTGSRRALAEIDNREKFVKALDGIALSPSLLFDYVQKEKRTKNSES